MSLARGEEPIQEPRNGVPAEPAPEPAVVIAIATSLEERVRIARLINDLVPVLLVSTREEAAALLAVEEPQPRSGPMTGPMTGSMTGSMTGGRAGLTALPDPGPAVGEQARGLEIDSDWRVASWRGRSVSLSPLEHDLLCCLLREVGHAWTFEQVHRTVWGNDHLGGRADVQSVVKRLRRKLRELDSPLQIQAVRGVGLRLTDSRALTVTLPAPRVEPLDGLFA